MKNTNIILTNTVISLFVMVIIFTAWDCKPKNGGEPLTNIPPITRLSNVPPPEDTVKTDGPRVSLNWVGDDPDGYVAGFRYRWNFQLSQSAPVEYKPYKTVLNIIINTFALMVNTDDLKKVPGVYKYFATLPPEGLNQNKIDSLARGDTIHVEGVGVYASNPDSVRIQTGARVKYSFPVHVNPNSGTFIFDSQDTLNFHTFEITAIDNIGDTSSSVSPNIRYISFWTPQVTPPVTNIVDVPEDSSLVLLNMTPTFRGLGFEFKGNDPNSRTIDYRWIVDKNRRHPDSLVWSIFSPSEFAYVAAGDFYNPYDTVHTFTVQARNEFGVIDTVGATATFTSMYPIFARPDVPKRDKILFLNVSYNASPDTASAIHPTYQMVDAFYHDVFNDLGIDDSIITDWRILKDPPNDFPSRGQISNYNLVVFCGDAVNEYLMWGNAPLLGGGRQAILKDYCYVGGNVIFSGWNIQSRYNTPMIPETYTNLWHINPTPLFNTFVKDTAFIGVAGQVGYPDLAIDPAKISPTWNCGLMGLWLALPYGFGEIIHKYKSCTLNPQYEDKPLSIRYRGVTFNVVYFGLPLYYMQRPGVDSTIARALRDVIDWKGPN